MSKLLICLFLFSIQSCQQPTSSNQQPASGIQHPVSSTQQPAPNFDLQNHLKKYKAFRQTIQAKRQQIKSNNGLDENQKLQLAKTTLSTFLIDSMYVYWAGTEWDFNGHTPEPRNGEVACGYFVSTPLKHMGFKLNRFKTAQKGATDIVKQLCNPNSIQQLSSWAKVEEYMQATVDDDVFIVGLDFHVGFLYKREGVIYFMHSNYIDRAGVMKEVASQSSAFMSSNAYVLGNLSSNRRLLQEWL